MEQVKELLTLRLERVRELKGYLEEDLLECAANIRKTTDEITKLKKKKINL